MNSTRWLYKIGIGCLAFVCLGLIFFLVFSDKPSPAGPETLALEKELLRYENRTFDEVAAHFGEPDDAYYPTIQGVVYVGWVYKKPDGQVRIMGPVRANYVEHVFSER